MSAKDDLSDVGNVVISEDELIQRHKKEQKELLGKIQKLKHGVPKGDKRKKKEMQEQVASLEASLTERHEAELQELRMHGKQIENLPENMERLCSGDQGETTPSAKPEVNSKKPSKAQKRREKKSQQNRDREGQITDQAKENLTGARHTESLAIRGLLEKKGLQIHEIHSDGNCLYNAISYQLSTVPGIETSNEGLRRQTAEYMRSHEDDFIPFLTNTKTGDPYTHDEYQTYCNEVESTSAWGGHLELQALSHVLRVPLEVIQADCPPILIGEEHTDKAPIVITYHHHVFGLGEHYNSTETKQPDVAEDGFS